MVAIGKKPAPATTNLVRKIQIARCLVPYKKAPVDKKTLKLKKM